MCSELIRAGSRVAGRKEKVLVFLRVVWSVLSQKAIDRPSAVA
jgi:hypothetical protein